MNPRFVSTALVALMLCMSVSAYAKAFKGLIDRRAVNDPTVKSSKIFNVEFQNTKMKMKKRKKSDRLAAPPKARTIRELKIIKIDAEEVIAAGKKKGGE